MFKGTKKDLIYQIYQVQQHNNYYYLYLRLRAASDFLLTSYAWLLVMFSFTNFLLDASLCAVSFKADVKRCPMLSFSFTITFDIVSHLTSLQLCRLCINTTVWVLFCTANDYSTKFPFVKENFPIR